MPSLVTIFPNCTMPSRESPYEESRRSAEPAAEFPENGFALE